MGLWQWLRRWRLAGLLRRRRIPATLWHQAVRQLPIIASLSRRERVQLRILASEFLQRKVIVGAGDFSIDESMRVLIAAQACLPILHLDLGYYDGWVEIILYPDSFVVAHPHRDEAGVVHSESGVFSGEAWDRGPVILSWEDIRPRPPGQSQRGSNVILHEFAHKLDMLDGSANGVPPLHQSMRPDQWSEDFSSAYQHMLDRLEHGHRSHIDPYAVQSPGEFFAVVSEVFFEAPWLLREELPSVYQRLSEFYRQAPHKRMSAHRHH